MCALWWGLSALKYWCPYIQSKGASTPKIKMKSCFGFKLPCLICTLIWDKRPTKKDEDTNNQKCTFMYPYTCTCMTTWLLIVFLVVHTGMFPLCWGIPVMTLWYPRIRHRHYMDPKVPKSNFIFILKILTQMSFSDCLHILHVDCWLICLREYLGSTMDPVWLYI